jgi:hypothetical protein
MRLKWIKFFFWLFPLGLFFFLFSRYFVFSGRLEFTYDMLKDSPYITLAPSGRVSDPFYDEARKRWYRKVESEPVYFDIRTPRGFQNAEVTVEYTNEKQDFIELGGLVDFVSGSYIFQPFENRQLDELNWSKIHEGDTVLWQREKKFETVAQFLENLPEKKEVLVYRYSLGEGFDGFSPLVSLEESDKNYLLAHYFAPIRGENGLMKQVLNFDFSSLQYGYHKYRFVFSAPRVTEEQGISIYRIHFALSREPVTWRNVWQRARDFIGRNL